MFFNLIIVSGLTVYVGRTTHGKATTTAMSLMSGIEASGVFLCSYIVPAIGRRIGGGAGTNMILSGIVLIIIGIGAYFIIKSAHKIAYKEKGNLFNFSMKKNQTEIQEMR